MFGTLVRVLNDLIEMHRITYLESLLMFIKWNLQTNALELFLQYFDFEKMRMKNFQFDNTKALGDKLAKINGIP